ncbi:MAG TPA: IS66 family transposase [Rhodoferax sp.]
MSFEALKTQNSPLEKAFEKASKTFSLPSVLPHDVGALQTLLVTQQNAHLAVVQGLHQVVQTAHQEALAMRAEAQTIRDEAHAYVIRMLEQATLARQRMFGASSEQMSAQSRLFDEAEVLAQNSTDAHDTAPIADEAPQGVPATAAPATKPARGKRAPLAAGLPRVDVLHDVPEADRTCPCGTPMVLIGRDISEQLDIVPMQVRVIRNIRNRYGCPGSQHAPVTAPLPPQPLPKSNASADFLAMLYTVKFVDGMPLTRFGKVLERHNAPVPSQTLARWVIAGSALLQPLHNLMRDILLDCSLIYMDETVVQVLKEPGKAPTTNSYMWVQTGGPPDKPVVLFDYDPSRSAQVPTRLLEGFKGYLMTDGYGGYNEIASTTGIERLACWAHVRRRFVEAVRVQPKGKRGKADEAVTLIGKLYRIEREFKDASPQERHVARQSQSVPVLADLHAWMVKTVELVTPKSALGTALAYMKNLWSMLSRYTERADLPIDNNRCENSIRPFVLGRKAWLFSDTPAGAHASAVIYSLVETAKANGVEPYAWLRRVLRELPSAKTVEDVEALLPWNLRLPEISPIPLP